MSEWSVTQSFRIRRDRHGRKRLKVGAESPSERIPRISRLMALAIQFDELIRSGIVADQTELAQRGKVSRARLTQIMDLLCLAPEIQEKLLFLNCDGAMKLATERSVRSITRAASWDAQLMAWRAEENT